MDTGAVVEAMVRVMAPYIGDTMARSATEAHCQKLGIPQDRITPEQLEVLLGKIGSGLNIFLGRDKSAAVMGEVRVALVAMESAS